MQVSFKNNFDKFNVNSKTNIPRIPKAMPKSEVNSFANIPTNVFIDAFKWIGTALAALGTAVLAVKNKKQIGAFVDKVLGNKPNSSTTPVKNTVNKAKEHVKEMYNKYLNRDILEERMSEVYKKYLDDPDPYWPNGVIYYGPNCKAKDKAIEDLVKYLEKQGWDIKRTPIFDESKAELIMEEGNYCSNFYGELIDTFISAEENYKKNGKRTAVIVRGLDTFTEPRQSTYGGEQIYRAKSEITNNILTTIEKLRENGCTWISDCTSLGHIDRALGRTGRIDMKILIRPLQEDSKKAWEEYLSSSYDSYKWVLGRHEALKTCPVDGKIHWRLQNAIDLFPERYRESSELYQKLKDTKFYPFEL